MPTELSGKRLVSRTRRQTGATHQRFGRMIGDECARILGISVNPWYRSLSSPAYHFDCYPLLFAEAFPGISEEAIERLAYALRTGFESIDLADQLFDSREGISAVAVIWKYLYEQECVRQLCDLFPRCSPFWSYYEKYLSLHVRALMLEMICVKQGMGTMTSHQFRTMCHGKMWIGRLMVPALALLSPSPQAVEKVRGLVSCHDRGWIGIYLLDDLTDWQDDYQQGRWTLVLRKALAAINLSPTDIVSTRPSSRAIESALRDGVAQWALHWALRSMRQSRADADTCGADIWSAVMAHLTTGAELMTADLTAGVGSGSLSFPSFVIR